MVMIYYPMGFLHVYEPIFLWLRQLFQISVALSFFSMGLIQITASGFWKEKA